MITPTREWRRFISFEDKLNKYKKWGLSSPKADFIRSLTYQGTYSKKRVLCDVVGYVDDLEIIIEIDGLLHAIHPAYLLEMQEGKAIPSENPFPEMGKSQ